ncbi:formate dehydrogenase subunit delta [Streptomyces sp. ZAF1911]|uniref:formate dehydrogenase subunit delta n=1 Tax=unclassified Streptomyces TaxID=2593676 RepID=UPI00202DFB95|nr:MULTISPECIES: formate dehydrogenase subunit delta [unclassified Streptomyces]MCM1966675.1 formate dehydrogenase subunit delta [Streptomyces sp. G1]MCX5126311.1 formate dehydrogenase subunit delta [Streptomyces sp. NBC_00347]MCX5299940.1 formate dehydrogenase subunit delta [Streptomyces sp. NBC_00193]MDD9376377.1 formate dehydrogenase subunit delta [Streptomyces sp. ZAF1911]
MAGTVPPESRMANDIAAHHGHLTPGAAAEAIAGHLGLFWDPRMRTRLYAYVDAGGDGLHPLVVAAVGLMR